MAKWIEGKIKIKPVVAIVCGSGLGGIADQVKDPQIIPYNDIPDFPRSTGKLLLHSKQCSDLDFLMSANS